LRGAADASHAQIALKEALERLLVRDIMTREVFTVAPDAAVAALADDFWRHHVTSFPVVDGAAVQGIASVHELREVPAQRWTTTPIAQVMRPISPELTVAPHETVLAALQKASTNTLGRLAVIDRGRLVGYLSLKDITHVLALRGLAEVTRSGASAAAAGVARVRPAL
jgi:CBS domain-containing protein